ncbi:oligoendopeptidase F [Clostridia bacterium]|nr:oligoendopeptidase F [Clostridia bacterium]
MDLKRLLSFLLIAAVVCTPVSSAAELDLSKPEELLGFFRLLTDSGDVFERDYALAYMARAAHNTDAAAVERLRAVRAEMAAFEKANAPLMARLNELPPEYLTECLKDERFAVYEPYLRSIIFSRGEKPANADILSALAPSMEFPAELANIVLGADFNPKPVARPDGTSVPATAAELSLALSGNDMRYRREAFEKYYAALNEHRNTLAAALEKHVSGRLLGAELQSPSLNFEAKTFLYRYEMPPAAADMLVSAVENSMPIYVKHLQLKAYRMGLSTLLPYEGVVPDGAMAGRYTYEQACELILSALKPLGAGYAKHAKRILASGHVNYQSAADKQPGAFCISAGPYTEPYIHLNFDGSLNSVTTLAHELGHAVNMVLSRQAQIPALSQPSLAVTETAAILNEILVSRELLNAAKTPEEVECAASSYASLIGSTLYQQTRYFSFERKIYDLAASGGVLTADRADALWNEVSEAYRGGVIAAPEISNTAWAGIPHLYRDFYVATYAFAVAAAEELADKSRSEVLAFLSSGGNVPAYDLFCAAGVDFSSENAYNKVVVKLDELYGILKGSRVESRT